MTWRAGFNPTAPAMCKVRRERSGKRHTLYAYFSGFAWTPAFVTAAAAAAAASAGMFTVVQPGWLWSVAA